MSGGRAYRVMVVEDQIDEEEVRKRLRADAERHDAREPHLELAGYVARNDDDALLQLESLFDLGEVPDAIVLDDYLLEGSGAASRSLQVMSWLCKRCIEDEIPVHARPRAVLWTACDPELVYTFCALGGLQFYDKRWANGLELPVRSIWAALAGERWQPDPFPAVGLDQERFRAPLPWIEAGWPSDLIDARAKAPASPAESSLAGVTLNTLETTRKHIREMPRTAKGGDGFPANLLMSIAAARRNGWVWVPLKWHNHIPPGAPLPLVIDPEAHRHRLPPAGRLPARW